jgi:hypothetical protein
MSILDRIGNAVGDTTTETDKALAAEIAETGDRAAVAELVVGLGDSDRNVQSSCIKVIYETGYIKPDVIADYWETFLKLLERKNNRLVWGGMVALSCVATLRAAELFPHAERIYRAVKTGTRITVDAGLKTLACIAAAEPKFAPAILPRIIETLEDAPANKLPAYAEDTVAAVTPEFRDLYVNVFVNRRGELKAGHIKRVNKALKNIGAGI